MINKFKKELELEDFSMIAGNSITLEYTVYDEYDNLLDLSIQREIMWVMSRIDSRKESIVKKSSLINGEIEIVSGSTGQFKVNLLTEDTEDLETNTYEYEVLIVAQNRQTSKPVYGRINIKESISY